MPRGVYKRKKKVKKVLNGVLPKTKAQKEAEKPKKKEKPKEVDSARLQFPKPKMGMAFGILRNRTRNIDEALKREK